MTFVEESTIKISYINILPTNNSLNKNLQTLGIIISLER